jgi:nucleoside-diphosphate-sugar epimerase
MRIVVTGALGHIGSRLIRDLPSAFPNAQIVMVDNMAVQRYPSLFNLPPTARYHFIEGDVLKLDLAPIFAGADVVMHLAAITNAAGSFEIASRVEKENFEATKRVAEACLVAGVPLIHLSSTSVYGTQAEVVDEDCPESDLQPQSPYAETKIREENLLKDMFAQGLKSVVCRFGTIFGVSPGIRFHTAVNRFCWQAVLGQPITVWTTAYDQKRPYLDLTDAMQAILLIMEKGLYDGRIYNVLTHNRTVRQVVDAIRAHVPELTVEFVDHKIMNQLSYDVSCARFECQGFVAKGDLARGIAETIAMLRRANTFSL